MVYNWVRGLSPAPVLSCFFNIKKSFLPISYLYLDGSGTCPLTLIATCFFTFTFLKLQKSFDNVPNDTTSKVFQAHCLMLHILYKNTKSCRGTHSRKRRGRNCCCKGTTFIWVVQEFGEKSDDLAGVFNSCCVLGRAKCGVYKPKWVDYKPRVRDRYIGSLFRVDEPVPDDSWAASSISRSPSSPFLICI